MSYGGYQIRESHYLYFKEKGKPDVEIGKLLTLTDCHRKVATKLYIHQVDKLENYPEFDRESTESFYLVIEKSDNREIFKFYDFLSQHSHKTGQIYLDSAATIGLLTALPTQDRPTFQNKPVFKCYVIERNKSEVSSPRSITGVKRGFEQTQAAGHYNDLVRDLTTRHQSLIYHLRQLNNWIKLELINIAQLSSKSIKHPNKVNSHSNSNSNNQSKGFKSSGMIKGFVDVLDLACGQGGDISKWMQNNINELNRYVGADIAKNSLQKFATERLVNFSLKDRSKVTHLICADLSTDSLISSKLEVYVGEILSPSHEATWRNIIPLTTSDLFDVISIQFSLHYFFQSKSKANHFFSEISRHLRPGGIVIATTIDSRVMREYVLQKEFGEYPSHSHSQNRMDDNNSENGDDEIEKKCVEIKNDFDKVLLRISFEQKHWDTIIGHTVHGKGEDDDNDDKDEDDGYGIQYDFSLYDDESSNAVNAPEWLVPYGNVFEDLIESHGLVLTKHQNFHDFIHERLRDVEIRNSFEKKNILNYKGTFSKGEWDIVRLYSVIVLYKPMDENMMNDTEATIHEFEDPMILSDTEVDVERISGHSFNNKNRDTVPIFAPSSPELPPPTSKQMPIFAPSSPKLPPPISKQVPIFAPSSPELPPPVSKQMPIFAPSSPELPPPTSKQMPIFAPSSPESPPPTSKQMPIFAPSSPEMPPPISKQMPIFAPSSPELPPPTSKQMPIFAPSSPELPPPTSKQMPIFAPSSPELPPPTSKQMPIFAPSSPEMPPPTSSITSNTNNFNQPKISGNSGAGINTASVAVTTVDNSGTNSTLSSLEIAKKARKLAIELAGGDDAWDNLDDDQMDAYLEQARQMVQSL